MDITTPTSWASSPCVLLILFMDLVTGAQFLSITFLSTLFNGNCYNTFWNPIVILNVELSVNLCIFIWSYISFLGISLPFLFVTASK